MHTRVHIYVVTYIGTHCSTVTFIFCSHMHTHTHTERERERQRDIYIYIYIYIYLLLCNHIHTLHVHYCTLTHKCIVLSSHTHIHTHTWLPYTLVGAPPWSSGSVLDHRSLPPVFESRRGHIWRLFRLSLRLITFGSRSAHLAYLVHKSGRKTSMPRFELRL